MQAKIQFGPKKIKKSRGRRSPGNRAPHFSNMARFGVHYNLKRTARLVSNFYDRSFREVGLKATQFSTLTCIRVNTGATVDELAAQMDMDGTTVTRGLKALEKAGWVRIRPGLDRRTRIAELTEDGSRKLLEAYKVWRNVQRHFLRALGREEWRHFKSRLRLIDELAGEGELNLSI